MATYTKAATAVMGRSNQIYLESGSGIAGNPTAQIKTGSGLLGRAGSGSDATTWSKLGTVIRTQTTGATRSGGTISSVSVSSIVVTGTSVVTSATAITGQGNYPLVRCRLSYDLVSVATPVWSEIDSSKLRGFAVSRGRADELSEFDAGTATVSFDNRDRAFDPLSNASIRPMNRIWLYCEFSGVVRDLFKGYVTSWHQDWGQAGGSDAIATANASDEFLVLSQAALPTTNPPRDSYAELIATDGPVGYWDMNEDPAARQTLATEIASVPEPVKMGLIEFKRHDRRRARPGSRRRHG